MSTHLKTITVNGRAYAWPLKAASASCTACLTVRC